MKGYKSWIIAFLFALMVVAPVQYFVFLPLEETVEDPLAVINFHEAKNVVLEPGVELNILSCSVIDGYRFVLYLDGGKKIYAHLAVATKTEGSQFIVQLLNKSQYPSATLLREAGGYWIVDVYLTHEGQRINVVDLLRTNNLLLN